MFSWVTRLATMHERTRRAICQAVFVCGCFLPTLGVLTWCVAHYLPGQTELCRRQLALQLGLEVTLDEVGYPRPGVTRLTGLELRDPELGTPLLSLAEVEVAQDSEQLSFVISQAELESDAPRRLWALLQSQMQGRATLKIRLRAPQVTVQTRAGVQRLTDVQARVEPTENGSQAVVAWKLAGLEMEAPYRVGVLRNRQTSPPSTQWQLETGPTPLPCALGAALLPGLKRMGPTSSYCGSVWAQETTEGWTGAVAGRFEQIDLKSALHEVWPHPLSGLARLQIERATFRAGRLETAQAAVIAEQGSYSRSLVIAAAEHLGMQVATRRDLLSEAEPYRELAFRVALDQTGVELSGLCRSGTPGAVLVSRWGPVLVQPTVGVQPFAGLVHMVCPDQTPLLPISAESEALTRWLPTPEAAIRQAQR